MKYYIATVWTLGAVAASVDGYSAMSRHVVRRQADSTFMFAAIVRDEFTRHVDDDVWFGPIGES